MSRRASSSSRRAVSVQSELPPSMTTSPGSRWGTQLGDHRVDRCARLHHDHDRARSRERADELLDAAAGDDLTLAAVFGTNVSVFSVVRLCTAIGKPCDAMLRTRFWPITARPVRPKCIPAPGWIGERLVAGVVAMGPFYQRPSLRTLWRMFEDLEAAGLFEGLPDEEFRRTIARHLLDAGFTDADVTAIVRSPDPGRDATFRLLFPEPRLTAAEFAARIDLPVEKIDRIRLAAGLPPTDSSSAAPVFSARDERVFAAFGAGSSLFGEDVLLQFVRVMGFSLAQIAEAAIALFATHVATPLTEQHAPPDVQFKAELDATRRAGVDRAEPRDALPLPRRHRDPPAHAGPGRLGDLGQCPPHRRVHRPRRLHAALRTHGHA